MSSTRGLGRRHAALALCICLAAGLLVAAHPKADGESAADTPRRIDGRIEPSIHSTPKPRKGEDRRQLIERVLRQEADAAAKLHPPLLFCRRVAEGVIKIDGKPDEAAWKRADVATNFRGTRDLKPTALKTQAMLLWDSRFLYAAFRCDDSNVISTINKPDGDYWREDTAEMFIDPDGDGMTYLEFEVSPRGLLYDGSIAEYRPDIDWPADLEHLDIEGSAARYRVRDSRVAANVAGKLNDDHEADRGWTCEMALSWADIRRGTDVQLAPPAAGDRWRIGLFHINNRQHGNNGVAEYNAWCPTTSWFHVPKLWGHVVFVTD